MARCYTSIWDGILSAQTVIKTLNHMIVKRCLTPLCEQTYMICIFCKLICANFQTLILIIMWNFAFLKMHCQFGNNGDSLTKMFSLFWRIPFQGWSFATMSHHTFFSEDFFSLQSIYQCVQPVSKIKECNLAFFRRINQIFWMQYW